MQKDSVEVNNETACWKKGKEINRNNKMEPDNKNTIEWNNRMEFLNKQNIKGRNNRIACKNKINTD